MEIKHEEKDSQGSFYIPGEKGKKPAAQIVYSIEQPERVIIQHTEVAGELQGKNIGYELVNAVVGYAREQQLHVVPLCSFANALMHRKKEFKDVL